MGIEEISGRIAKPKRVSGQLLRYLAVGAAATVADMGTVALFRYLLGVPELLCNVFGFSVGLTINYLISILWVFEKSRVTSRAGEFAVFLAVGLLGLAIRAVIIWGLKLLMAAAFFGAWIFAPMNELIRTGIAIVIVLLYNFTARKLILYRDKAKDMS